MLKLQCNPQKIPTPVTHPQKLEVMELFLKQAPIGDVVEVGVFQGGSLYYLASKFPNRKFFGYDTFEGMPNVCHLDNFCKKGIFKSNPFKDIKCLFKKLKNVTLIKGLYPQSDYIKPKVIMAHVDVDIYTSTRDSFQHLSKLILPFGRIYCDDAYVDTCNGATIAYEEFCRKNHKSIHKPYAYIDF